MMQKIFFCFLAVGLTLCFAQSASNSPEEKCYKEKTLASCMRAIWIYENGFGMIRKNSRKAIDIAEFVCKYNRSGCFKADELREKFNIW